MVLFKKKHAPDDRYVGNLNESWWNYKQIVAFLKSTKNHAWILFLKKCYTSKQRKKTVHREKIVILPYNSKFSFTTKYYSYNISWVVVVGARHQYNKKGRELLVSFDRRSLIKKSRSLMHGNTLWFEIKRTGEMRIDAKKSWFFLGWFLD